MRGPQTIVPAGCPIAGSDSRLSSIHQRSACPPPTRFHRSPLQALLQRVDASRHGAPAQSRRRAAPTIQLAEAAIVDSPRRRRSERDGDANDRTSSDLNNTGTSWASDRGRCCCCLGLTRRSGSPSNGAHAPRDPTRLNGPGKCSRQATPVIIAYMHRQSTQHRP
jgi:hypothetical protein